MQDVRFYLTDIISYGLGGAVVYSKLLALSLKGRSTQVYSEFAYLRKYHFFAILQCIAVLAPPGRRLKLGVFEKKMKPCL